MPDRATRLTTADLSIRPAWIRVFGSLSTVRVLVTTLGSHLRMPIGLSIQRQTAPSVNLALPFIRLLSAIALTPGTIEFDAMAGRNGSIQLWRKRYERKEGSGPCRVLKRLVTICSLTSSLLMTSFKTSCSLTVHRPQEIRGRTVSKKKSARGLPPVFGKHREAHARALARTCGTQSFNLHANAATKNAFGIGPAIRSSAACRINPFRWKMNRYANSGLSKRRPKSCLCRKDRLHKLGLGCQWHSSAAFAMAPSASEIDEGVCFSIAL